MNQKASDGFEEFFRERSAALLRYAYVLTGNAHDAADLTQEALARLRGAWHRVRRDTSPEGYVRTTMVRLHVSWWRRKRREWLAASVPERPVVAHPAQAGGDLWRAMETLPARQRVILVLRYYEDRPDQEIAEALGISAVTVRSQASRALAKLRVDPRLAAASLEGTA
ncbi:SigE family RNA polymerase sigma factor [Longispora albida]|uniref:SigE family RNA polymerase sigma factor n=1 Tax=Longispora albida TaxID=203523 RepID=UPI0003799F5C|nr:SigE family RNA polymerase sigma factor [Longispora albida]